MRKLNTSFAVRMLRSFPQNLTDLFEMKILADTGFSSREFILLLLDIERMQPLALTHRIDIQISRCNF
jgi:hypothetical protein